MRNWDTGCLGLLKGTRLGVRWRWKRKGKIWKHIAVKLQSHWKSPWTSPIFACQCLAWSKHSAFALGGPLLLTGFMSGNSPSNCLPPLSKPGSIKHILSRFESWERGKETAESHHPKGSLSRHSSLGPAATMSRAARPVHLKAKSLVFLQLCELTHVLLVGFFFAYVSLNCFLLVATKNISLTLGAPVWGLG